MHDAHSLANCTTSSSSARRFIVSCCPCPFSQAARPPPGGARGGGGFASAAPSLQPPPPGRGMGLAGDGRHHHSSHSHCSVQAEEALCYNKIPLASQLHLLPSNPTPPRSIWTAAPVILCDKRNVGSRGLRGDLACRLP